MGRLLLVRHGESEGNRDRVFTRTPAVPITELGREQARTAAEALHSRFSPARLVSSSFTRAQQTAEIIGGVVGLEVEIIDDFRERSYGTLAGQPYATPRPDYDATSYWEWAPPEGETLAAVCERVGRALDTVAAATPHDDVVIVSHGGVMLALWRHVTGRWATPRHVTRNAGIIVVEHDAGSYRDMQSLDPV